MNVIGPIPQMAMTARLGAVGLDAVMVRRASDAADEGAGGADTVSVGIEFVAARHPPGAGDNDAIAVGLGRARQRTST